MKDKHELAEIVKHFDIKIPIKHWDKIVVGKKDDNLAEDFSNLYYRFSEPVESDLYRGFYHVPYFTSYVLNRDGVCISTFKNQVKKWTVQKNDHGDKNRKMGYLVGNAMKDAYGRHGASLHRFMATTFCKYDCDVSDLVVNHIDGNPSNNAIDNLELITKRENNIHAIENGLAPNSVTPVLVKNLNTGESWSFPSYASGARALNMSEPTFYKRANVFSNIKFEDGICVKINDGSPWPELTVEKKSPKYRRVVARNVFTGVMTVAVSCTMMESIIGVQKSTIHLHCANRSIAPFRGYNFRFIDESDTFPLHTEKHLLTFKHCERGTPKGVVARNAVGVEKAFYESVSIAAVALGKSESSIWRLAKSKHLFDDMYIEFYTEHAPLLGDQQMKDIELLETP